MTEKEEKGKKDPAAAAPAPQDAVESLILDRATGKYQVVDRISLWAKELRRREENRHLTQTEILDLAMSEVLGGKVSEEELEKRLQAQELEPESDGSGAKKEAAEKGKK